MHRDVKPANFALFPPDSNMMQGGCGKVWGLFRGRAGEGRASARAGSVMRATGVNSAALFPVASPQGDARCVTQGPLIKGEGRGVMEGRCNMGGQS